MYVVSVTVTSSSTSVGYCVYVHTAWSAETVATYSCHPIWPTGYRDAVIGWLTNPRAAALLWLVVQIIPQSFAAAAKNSKEVTCPPVGSATLGGSYWWLQLFAFKTLASTVSTPVYCIDFDCTSSDRHVCTNCRLRRIAMFASDVISRSNSDKQ